MTFFGISLFFAEWDEPFLPSVDSRQSEHFEPPRTNEGLVVSPFAPVGPFPARYEALRVKVKAPPGGAITGRAFESFDLVEILVAELHLSTPQPIPPPRRAGKGKVQRPVISSALASSA